MYYSGKQVVNCGEKWGDNMFSGEYHHSIDEKKRLIIPSKFRETLSNRFIITRGLENCLFIYPTDEWNKIVTKLSKLPFTKKDARNFSRFFLSGATEVELDKQGRIIIPNTLTQFASLKKDCVLIGVLDRIEIWSSESWNDFFNENKDKLSEISENLFSSDIDLDV